MKIMCLNDSNSSCCVMSNESEKPMIKYLGHRIRARSIIDFNLDRIIQDKSIDKIEENKPHRIFWNETKTPHSANAVVHDNNAQFKGFSHA